MKKVVLLALILASGMIYAQALQDNAPWMNGPYQKKGKVTFKDVIQSAEKYFNTIDRDKKGSGLKPYERWKYHWSFYLKDDGSLSTAKDLWDAWEVKRARGAKNKSKNTGNWTSLGPYSHTNTASWSAGQGRVNAIAVDPNNSNTYYVGAPAGGIWKSTDAGVNWSPLTDYLPQIGVSGIAIDHNDSNTIYIATGDDDNSDSFSVGVRKSTDGGQTWNATGSMVGNPQKMNEIYIHPSNSNTILVATSTGVFKSTNGGTTWVQKLSGNIIDLKMKPGDASTWYAVSRNTFYKSTNSGESFSSVSISGLTNSGRLTMDVTKANANYVYLVSATTGNGFNGVYRSTDSGSTFSKTAETDNIFESTQAWYDLALTVSDVDANTVFVGVLNIWKSTDGGNNFNKLNSWNAPNSDSYTHADIHFLRYIDGKFFAGTDGGIYVSTNHGTKFTDLTENLAISQFYKISVAAQNAGNIVGGLQDNGGYAYHGSNWSNYYGADGMDCAVSGQDADTYYGFVQYGGQIYETNDGGKTRHGGVLAPAAERGTNDSGGRWVTPMVSNSKGVIYAGYSQLYKFENRSWSRVSNNSSFGGDLYNIEIDPKNDNNIYVSRGFDLYKSTDAGVNFTQVPLSVGTINGIEVSSTDANTVWVVTNGGVYKTTNMNSANPTFTNLSSGIPIENKLVVKHHERSGKNTIYLGTALGVYYMSDSDTSWKVFDNNLPNVQVRDLEINEEEAKLYAGTYGRGVFVTDIPQVAPASDVRVLAIDSPKNTVNCGGAITPTITVKNQGTQNISAVTVSYTYDSGAAKQYVWNGTIVPGRTQSITLPVENLNKGSHSVNVEATITNDAYSSNNTAKSSFVINDTSTDPTTISTFESASDVLLQTSSSGIEFWQRAIPNKTLLKKANSGTFAYVSWPFGNYPNRLTGYLYSECYDMTKISNPILKFKMAFDIEINYDYLTLEYSTDQGKTWKILGSATDTNWYTSSTTANGLPGKQWTGEGASANPQGGTNATFHDYSYNLSAFTGETTMTFRFKFVSDAAVNREGVIIDDFGMDGTLPVEDVELAQAISVQPNPSSGIFNLTWKSGEKLNIKVFDLRGKLILQERGLENNAHRIDMSKYAGGLYFLQINVNDRFATKKLIVE